jgi:hypothetical protein
MNIFDKLRLKFSKKAKERFHDEQEKLALEKVRLKASAAPVISEIPLFTIQESVLNTGIVDLSPDNCCEIEVEESTLEDYVEAIEKRRNKIREQQVLGESVYKEKEEEKDPWSHIHRR